MPITIGHEFSGTITEIGSKVKRTDLKVGDQVAVQPTIACFGCGACREGFINCCDGAGFVGLSGWGGGLSEAVCIGEDFIFKLPDGVGLDIGGELHFPCLDFGLISVSAFCLRLLCCLTALCVSFLFFISFNIRLRPVSIFAIEYWLKPNRPASTKFAVSPCCR